jgi:succinate dehydrogenase/fumarate reductase flavoprotein subunit
MSSGTWSGQAAARFARRRVAGHAQLHGAGSAGVDAAAHGTVAPDEVIRSVQAEVLPPGKNMFRTGSMLRESVRRLDEVWSAAVPGLGLHRGRLRAREAAAMTAHARWMYRAALARGESRGIHRRDDRPDTDPAQAHRLRTGGLDQVWVAADPLGWPEPAAEEAS